MTKQSGVPDAERALKASNDTTRIATSLASPPRTPSRHVEPGIASDRDGPPLSAAVVEIAIRERALRWTLVSAQLLTDSAWDMLLELLHAEITERCVTSSILWKAAGVPSSTGRRWIDALVAEGLCKRATDADDRETIELSRQGSEAMRRYFAEVAARPDEAA